MFIKSFQNSLKEEKYSLIAISVVFLLLTLLTWNRYGTLSFFDQTRDLSLLYFLSNDLTFYKDINVFYPPLIYYILAYITKITSLNLAIIHVTGLIVTYCYSILLYFLSRNFFTRTTAALVSVLFLSQIAFNQLGAYMFPYSITAPAGLFVTTLIIYLLILNYQTNYKHYIHWAVALTMLNFFIKQDFFISSFLILTLFFLLKPLQNICTVNEKVTQILTNIVKNFNYKEYAMSVLLIIVPIALISYLISLKTGMYEFISCMFPVEFYSSEPIKHFVATENQSSINFTNIITAIKLALMTFFLYMVSTYAFYKAFCVKLESKKLILLKYIVIVLALLLLCLPVIHGKPLIILLFHLFILKSPLFYAGISIFTFFLLGYLIYKRNIDNNIPIIFLSITALIVSFRAFLYMKLNSYPLFYLPLSIVVFVYLLYNVFPCIFADKIKIKLEPWKKATTIFLIIVAVLYSINSVLLCNSLKLKTVSYFGEHYSLNENQNSINNLILEAAEYIKNNTSSDDTILAYPTLTRLYLYTQRLPGSRHYHVYPSYIQNKKQEQKAIKEIQQKKPKFIAISNTSFEKRTGYTKFGEGKFHPDLYKWIIKNYKLDKQFNYKNWVIDIYKRPSE